MLAPGTTIGPYGVEERIASGGRSEVFRGATTRSCGFVTESVVGGAQRVVQVGRIAARHHYPGL